jgi:hypothetical protein
LTTDRPLIWASGTVPGRPTGSPQAKGGAETAGVGTVVGAGGVGTGVTVDEGAGGDAVGPGDAQPAAKNAAIASAVAARNEPWRRRAAFVLRRAGDADD